MVDLGTSTVLPGLIDCHTHLMARESETPNGYELALITKSQSTRALEGAANARATLRAGFTTVRDVENAAWAGVHPKGVQAFCPPARDIAREAPSAALLGPFAPALTLNRASIPPIRKDFPEYRYFTKQDDTKILEQRMRRVTDTSIPEDEASPVTSPSASSRPSSTTCRSP